MEETICSRTSSQEAIRSIREMASGSASTHWLAALVGLLETIVDPVAAALQLLNVGRNVEGLHVAQAGDGFLSHQVANSPAALP